MRTDYEPGEQIADESRLAEPQREDTADDRRYRGDYQVAGELHNSRRD